MTRPEAEQVRERLSAEHPDRHTHSFILSERDGIWSVAKVALPALAGLVPQVAASAATGGAGEAAGPGATGSWLAGG